MKTDWTSIRVRRDTVARLRGVILSLQRATEVGSYTAAAVGDQGITLDEAIRVLLARDDQHRKRRVKAARKRGKGKGSLDQVGGNQGG